MTGINYSGKEKTPALGTSLRGVSWGFLSCAHSSFEGWSLGLHLARSYFKAREKGNPGVGQEMEWWVGALLILVCSGCWLLCVTSRDQKLRSSTAGVAVRTWWCWNRRLDVPLPKAAGLGAGRGCVHRRVSGSGVGRKVWIRPQAGGLLFKKSCLLSPQLPPPTLWHQERCNQRLIALIKSIHPLQLIFYQQIINNLPQPPGLGRGKR